MEIKEKTFEGLNDLNEFVMDNHISMDNIINVQRLDSRSDLYILFYWE